MTADNMVIEKENVIENRYASTSSKPEQAAATSSASEQQAHVFSPELLSMYYSRLFPFELLHSWLAYDPAGKHPQLFSRREFSFTIEPVPGEEIYIRYQSFAGQQELQDAVCKRRPHKIDIGAIFSHPPKDKNTVTNFATVQRELVFDIDLTDYDEVRHCGCSGAKICGKCWTFMNMAVKVMDQGLKEDFGFERLTWFYSGRRGVHCWVCDESARELSNEARSSVAQYFEVSVVEKMKKGCSALISF
jgi:DNA primase small subunit